MMARPGKKFLKKASTPNMPATFLYGKLTPQKPLLL